MNVNTIQAIATLLSALIIPWLVQLIKTKAMSSEVARWVALGVSLAAGVVTGLASGIPSTPEQWVTCILAVVGGIQVAYTAFKAVGVTNAWLDALLNIGSTDGKHTVAAVEAAAEADEAAADDAEAATSSGVQALADDVQTIEAADEPTPIKEVADDTPAVG